MLECEGGEDNTQWEVLHLHSGRNSSSAELRPWLGYPNVSAAIFHQAEKQSLLLGLAWDSHVWESAWSKKQAAGIGAAEK